MARVGRVWVEGSQGRMDRLATMEQPYCLLQVGLVERKALRIGWM